jgi:16S rRNA (cytidine1402-2'-O)-methyltransferase
VGPGSAVTSHRQVRCRKNGGVADEGLLVLAATPIGDLADAPARLADELAAADVIAAEDTRRLRRLIAALGAQTPARIVSYYDANEAARTPELVQAMEAGARVVLVTDAGMPSVSDPGYRLVTATIEAGIRVTAVPGPSAVLAALAVSGLPVVRFCFEGFLPRRAGERATRLRELASEPRTLVFFEAPHRLAATLAALRDVFGADRAAAVCRELTKRYEQVRRGPLEELAEWAADGVRGEITLVVAGASPHPAADADAAALAGQVAELEAAGIPRKAAIAAVATKAGVQKRQVYDAVHRKRDAPVTLPRQ